jgi:hypothetical protein
VEKSGESRKTIAMVGSTVIPQAPSPLTLLQKQMQRKLNVEIAMGTMSMMKQVVNETGAYVLQGNENFEGAELAEMKDSAILFDELLLATKRA